MANGGQVAMRGQLASGAQTNWRLITDFVQNTCL